MSQPVYGPCGVFHDSGGGERFHGATVGAAVGVVAAAMRANEHMTRIGGTGRILKRRKGRKESEKRAKI